MSYETRIQAALAVVAEHNTALGVTNPDPTTQGYVNPDDFIAAIKAVGGTSEERLAQLSHEDIIEVLPDVNVGGKLVKPRILAKAVAAVFRSKATEDPTKTDEKRPISGKKAEKMTVRELVENFDAEDYTNAVGVRLSEISKGQPFIVYVSGRTLDVEATHKLLLEIKQGYPGREDVDVNGFPTKVYRIGELPENFADENPLYRGRPLRPDGTCDQTGRSWEGVPMNVRQLVRLAADTELVVTIETAHNVLDMVMGNDPFKKLAARYRTPHVKFGELQKTGNLPRLKIALGGSEGSGPFDGAKKVVWVQDPALPNTYVNRPANHRNSGTFTSNVKPYSGS
jgi:hypothetical protein